MPIHIPVRYPISRVPDQSDSKLVGAWLNKKTDGAKDYSVNENDGTPTDVIFGGCEGVGGTFNGSSSIVNCGDINAVDGISALTISTWIKASSLRDFNTIIIKVSNTSNRFGLRLGGSGVGDNNEIIVLMGNGSNTLGYTSSSPIKVDQWINLVMVFDGSATGNSNRLKLYINSIEDTLTYSGTIPTTTPSTAANLNIGEDTTVANVEWDGDIEDVRVYTEAKSANWIKNEFRKAVPDDSLRLYIPKGDRDYSRFRNTLTRSGGVIVGNGIEHDGTDDKIDCGDIGNIQTVDFLVNPNSATEELLLIDTGKDIMVSSGVITYTGLTAVATYVNGVATTTLAAEQWSHVVCVFSQVDANNFETANDSSNYGQIDMRELRAFDEVKSIDWAKSEYLRMRKFV